MFAFAYFQRYINVDLNRDRKLIIVEVTATVLFHTVLRALARILLRVYAKPISI